MKPITEGDRVAIMRKGQVLYVGRVYRFWDDADEVQANVEQFVTVICDKIGARGFRRSAGLSGGRGGWKAKARCWVHGHVDILHVDDVPTEKAT